MSKYLDLDGLTRYHEQSGKTFGYIKWNGISVNSGSWATHLGNSTTGYGPSDDVAFTGGYNLRNMSAGMWLFIGEIVTGEDKTSGIRGMRLYINETAQPDEKFFAPTGITTGVGYGVWLVTLTGDTNNARLGYYQNSGATATVKGTLYAIKVKE